MCPNSVSAILWEFIFLYYLFSFCQTSLVLATDIITSKNIESFLYIFFLLKSQAIHMSMFWAATKKQDVKNNNKITRDYIC